MFVFKMWDFPNHWTGWGPKWFGRHFALWILKFVTCLQFLALSWTFEHGFTTGHPTHIYTLWTPCLNASSTCFLFGPGQELHSGQHFHLPSETPLNQGFLCEAGGWKLWGLSSSKSAWLWGSDMAKRCISVGRCGLGRLLSGQSLPAAALRSFFPAGRFWRPPCGFAFVGWGCDFGSFAVALLGVPCIFARPGVLSLRFRGRFGGDFRFRLRRSASFRAVLVFFFASSLRFLAFLLVRGWERLTFIIVVFVFVATLSMVVVVILKLSSCGLVPAFFDTPFSALVSPKPLPSSNTSTSWTDLLFHHLLQSWLYQTNDVFFFLFRV